jgi:hypothetical protein
VIGQAVKETASLVDRRSFITTFLPSLLFCLLLAATWVVADEHSVSAALAWWTARKTSVQTTTLVVLLAVSALLTQMLQATRVPLLKSFEGHGTAPHLLGIAALGRAMHQRRFRRAPDPGSLQYPPPTRPEELQPTRLGNILRAGELYSLTRYGIDAIVVWPRLYHVLPDRLLSALTDARAQLELLLTVSFLGGTFSLTAGAWLYRASVSTTLVLGCFWGGALVAAVAYKTALSAAITYSHQVASAFDLHRHSLIA